MDRPTAESRPSRFLLLYALAWAGGAIAYTPLLTILLPVRVAAAAGQAEGVEWLALIALVGAVAASIGGILFGYLSDISRNRRGWIIAGLLLSSLLLPLIGQVDGLGPMLVLILIWQLAVNMMLGPLSALAGDHVPTGARGRLGGLMAFAPLAGAAAGVVVTHPALPLAANPFLLVSLMVAACMAPLLLLQPLSNARIDHRAGRLEPPARHANPQPRRSVQAMWLARLAVQLAEATLFAYLYFWLRSIEPGTGSHQAARLFGVVMLLSIPLALAIGRWSDQRSRPIAPLAMCAAMAAIGLSAMSLAPDIRVAMLSFGLFGVASAVFLSLHSAQTLAVLPSPERRGRDLGLFNLANTVPSLIMPPMVVALVPEVGFSGLFACLAALASLAALLLFAMARAS